VQQGKLVRDRIPEIIRSTGGMPEVRVLEGDELLEALLPKLEE
jgi:predicted house-cleaning noncanonical NTP pyrophosphatase (MazG superfamily)